MTFLYANGFSCGSAEPVVSRVGGWNVPRDTVIQISVHFKTARKLSELKIDETKYKKLPDPEMSGLVYYADADEGMTIAVAGGIDVMSMTYSPSAGDNHFRCPPTEEDRSTRNHTSGWFTGSLFREVIRTSG